MSVHTIDHFNGDYYFLSNFYPCKLEFSGLVYNNAEAAFQAQKSLSEETRAMFVGIAANSAKQLGRKVQLREDWEDVKDDIMANVVYAKFTQNPDLAQMLLDTDSADLIETNWWGDQYWGVCGGIGKNKLGKILMKLREELKQNA